jgi:hypothetical protein
VSILRRARAFENSNAVMAPIQLISALPKCVSLEEHTSLIASTPASFSDIPPVLRHKQENVSVIFDPPLDNLSQELLVKGTLYVIERFAPIRALKRPVISCNIPLHVIAYLSSLHRLVMDFRSGIPVSPFTLSREPIQAL